MNRCLKVALTVTGVAALAASAYGLYANRHLLFGVDNDLGDWGDDEDYEDDDEDDDEDEQFEDDLDSEDVSYENGKYTFTKFEGSINDMESVVKILDSLTGLGESEVVETIHLSSTGEDSIRDLIITNKLECSHINYSKPAYKIERLGSYHVYVFEDKNGVFHAIKLDGNYGFVDRR